MKKITNLLLMLTAVLFSSNILAQAPPGSGWTNVFADEFNGTTINTNTWQIKNPDVLGQEASFLRSNVSLQNFNDGSRGIRILNRYPVGGIPTGAWLQSVDEFAKPGRPKYGYYEARIRLVGPNNGKIWPSFWLWGNFKNGQLTTEIDLMEYSGSSARWFNSRATSSQHARTANGVQKPKIFPASWNPSIMLGDSTTPAANAANRDVFSGFHVWGVNWQPNKIEFFYDGQPYYSTGQAGANNAALENLGLKIILSSSPHTFNVFGNNTGPRAYQGNNPLGADLAAKPGDNLGAFEIDWVRVWVGGNINGGNNGGNNGGAPIGQIISFRKKGGDQQYVTTDLNQAKNLIARGGSSPPTQVWKTWERYRVVNHPNGGVALQSLASNQYVRVNGTNINTPVRGDGGLGSFSKFIWANGANNNEFALQSALTGKWVQAPWNQNNAVLYPRGNAFNTWETFVYLVQPSNKFANQDGSTKIELSPNPVDRNENINININVSNGYASLEIYSLLGQIVYKNSNDQLADGPTTITVPANLDSGIYLVKINTGGKISTTKFIVK